VKKIIILIFFFTILTNRLALKSFATEETKDEIKKEETTTKRPDSIEEYNKRTEGGTREETGSSSFLPSMIILIIILGGFYYIIKIIRKKKVPDIKEVPYMSSIGTLSLPSGGYLEIVEIGNKVLILGVSNNSVSLIKEIDDPDLILKIKQNPPTIKVQTFLGVLSKVFEKKGLHLDLQEPKSKFVDYLKKQKERLKKLK